MTNGWTGAHYRLFRAAFGVYLGVHIARGMPGGLLAALGLLAAAAFAAGLRDRIAAAALVGVLGASTFRGAHQEPALPILAWILLAHVAVLRVAPFGAW